MEREILLIKIYPNGKYFILIMEFELIGYDDIEEEIDRIVDSYRTEY